MQTTTACLISLDAQNFSTNFPIQTWRTCCKPPTDVKCTTTA